MKFTRRQALAAAVSLGTAVTAAFSGHALAQAYPSKPITIIVAYPAGGDTDAMARLYAEKLATRLGQTVVVDNKPGASGTIGASFVSKAPADGYTLLMAPSTFSIAQLVLKTGSGSSYDEVKGFTPIVQTSVQPLFIRDQRGYGHQGPEGAGRAVQGQAAVLCQPGQRLADAHHGRDVQQGGRREDLARALPRRRAGGQ